MHTEMKEHYTEKYYKDRAYTFGNRYPIIYTVASLLCKAFKPRKVLDVGCARGYMVYAFKELGVEAFGVDISRFAIEHAHYTIRPNLSVVDVDSHPLPFSNSTFDLIVSTECMEHLNYPRNVISEMGRVLMPNGRVFISTPKITKWRKLYGRIFGGSILHPSELDKEEWIRLFEKQGLKYMGDPFNQLSPIEKEEYSRNLRYATYPIPPALGIGKMLNRLGPSGKQLRVKLNLLVWQSQNLAFRKELE